MVHIDGSLSMDPYRWGSIQSGSMQSGSMQSGSIQSGSIFEMDCGSLTAVHGLAIHGLRFIDFLGQFAKPVARSPIVSDVLGFGLG
jgi:hypothetical protein